MLAQEVIRRKRDGLRLGQPQIEHFVRGLVDGSWSEGQVAALAMAMFLQGMDAQETIALTRAMTHSGVVMDWSDADLPGPVLDKHSTGGVGDKVSLMLAPIVAACGGFVPMVSGRGLGHTGGTLDKLSSIPGYQASPDRALLRRTLQTAGCAIIGQTAELAPADGRLYAIRDVTATVESIALITASILSKKLAAGLQGLVMDVKTGNGAFAASLAMAEALAQSLVQVANGAGLPTRAWITDMNQVLGQSCGNALELREAIDFLQGTGCEARLREVTCTLSAELLVMGHLAPDHAHALQLVESVLANGAALEHFARMVAQLGGPTDLVQRPLHYLPVAPEQVPVLASRSGWVSAMDTRAIGLLVVELGGGRRQARDNVDVRVGLADVVQVGQPVQSSDLLAMVHGPDPQRAQAIAKALQQAIHITDHAPALTPTLIKQILPAPGHA